jgi:hypothetical protein
MEAVMYVACVNGKQTRSAYIYNIGLFQSPLLALVGRPDIRIIRREPGKAQVVIAIG